MQKLQEVTNCQKQGLFKNKIHVSDGNFCTEKEMWVEKGHCEQFVWIALSVQQLGCKLGRDKNFFSSPKRPYQPWGPPRLLFIG